MHRLHALRYYLLALTVLAAVVLWPGVQVAVQMDNSLGVWFLEDDPALAAYHDFRARFGNDEVVILVVHDRHSLLTPAYFRAFRDVTRSLERVPGVAAVSGPGNAVVPQRGAGGLDAGLLLPYRATAPGVRRTLERLPTLREQLFAPDYRTARFLITLQQLPDFDVRRGAILAQVQRTIHRYLPAAQTHLGGVGVIYDALNRLSQQDFGFFLGVGYLLVFLALLVLYRNGWLLLYALSIVGTATWLTLGIYGTLGYRLNLMTVLLPVIIILLGLLDAMHVINERNHLAAEAELSPLASTLRALRAVFWPCLFTACTTAAGFLSLLTSPMAILRTFGGFAALGIAFCLLFTFGWGVVVLPFTPPTPRATRATSAGLVRLYGWVLRHRRLHAAVALALVGLFGLGTLRLRSDTYTLGYLPPTNPVVLDHQAMEASWGPYMPLELLVQPTGGRSLADPAVVQAAVAFADSVRHRPGGGRVFGFESLYLAGLEARYGPLKARRMLRGRAALDRLHHVLLTDYPALARQFIHDSSGTGRITVTGPMLSARQLTAQTDTLLRVARATLGAVATVRLAGYQPMYAGIVRYVTESQTTSLLLSFVLVFGLTWAFIRSGRLALLTVLPNLFPVLVLLGTMGWLGIALDTATASIAAIVLGICTDDTIHYIYYYRRSRRAGLSPLAARNATIAHVGPAIVLTSLLLLGGYAFMALGALRTVQLFGLLTAVALVAALYGELILFPVVLERFDREED